MRKLLIVPVILLLAGTAWGQGVTLTYQGQLQQSGTPHNGSVDLEFRLYDSETGGSQVGATVTRTDVPVVDGLFQAELDFTVFDFEGTGQLFLEVTVDGLTLDPRQRVTASPVAAYALWSPAGSGSPWDSVSGGLEFLDGDVRVGSSGFDAARLRVDAGSNFDGVHASTGSSNGYGVWGNASGIGGRGVYGQYAAASGLGYGVYGRSASADGIAGWFTGTGTALLANTSSSSSSVAAFDGGQGIRIQPDGTSSTAISISGGDIEHDTGFTIRALTANMRLSSSGWIALSGGSSGDNLRVESDGEIRALGDLTVSGNLSKGGGSFRIDHPLDPENRLLYHSFVESPDMMNVYNGNATTDMNGYAEVTLPEYFEALNRDFRYQLTVIGTSSASDNDLIPQAMVARKIENNRFVIRTDQPFVEVSWQVTGIRQDSWAQANRVEVEVDKPAGQRGKYVHPHAYGQPASKSMDSSSDEEPVQ